ncbi:MAG: hypothetical protein FD161_618 [Limisphaerales bacterium]|nr:MAG: hypothetical protein FD161_618 [Limisphaerales bacterium]KAG0510223.1 MAG: hypothetical protein E1N63_618 [Limisphaerales bacterium]TXT51894.1 MAG: hypothetical protein FD140_1282 [Limisphaerales bacterium]
MKMLLWTLPLSLGLAAAVLAQQPPGKKGPGGPPDPATAFRFLDTNRDGKMDKREFARSPRFRDQSELADATFALLDKNKDGSLTQAEFNEIVALAPGGPRPGDNTPTQPQFASPKSATAAKAPERAASPEEVAFFESKIRPVLVEKCYKCHATGEGNKIKGGLALDTKEGIRKGGDGGPAVVPGDTKRSLLLEAIRYTKNDLQMPPEKDGGKLSDAVIKDFERWIQTGAADPRTGGAVAKKEYDGSKAKDHWAYQPPKKSPVPAVKNTAWPRTDIDRFVLASLESKDLAPVSDAGKLTLLRRVYFDLIGLPPTFDEVNAFLDDKSADPFANVVDKLLASPQFGERWGRHWLDVARYAESTGKDVNTAYPHAWRYRDYVIASFNADKPYDRFVREQVAGDLLPSGNDKQKAEQLVATGFLAIGSRGLNEQNPRQFHMDVADEQIDALSQAFLGTTIACARCHDHKFDPISQKDYYALAGIFTSTETRYGTTQGVQNRRPSELIELPKGANAPTLGRTMSSEERARQEKQLAEKRSELRDLFMPAPGQKGKGPQQDNDPRRTLDRLRLLAETGQLESRLKQYDTATGAEKALAMGVLDLPATRTSEGVATVRRFAEGRIGGSRPTEFSAIGDASLYTRGDVSKPAELVARAFPVALTHSTPPRIPTYASGRKELAEWLTTSMNPLTARVYVNRAWHWLLGQGIVDSPDNFGTTGGKPSNPALLDTLAVRFMENGWSTKKLVREIVLSHAYQLSSAHDERNHVADPENTLNWRMSPRRLDAECLRDAMLAVGGTLDLKPPLASVVLTMGDLPIDGPNRFGVSDAQLNADVTHRSVYLPIVRDRVPETLALFDFPEASLVSGSRETTSVPSQALFMLNSDFVADCAGDLARRVTGWKPSAAAADTAAQFRERVNVAYWLAFTRPPSGKETQAATDYFAKFTGGKPATPALTAAAWTSYCRALFASAEFRHLN